MPEHLVLILDAPLVAFGGEIIDNRGVVRDFPGLSNLVGLLGNALGIDRAEGPRLDALQQRLVAGSLRLREGTRLRDFQTAQLAKDDMGWTTHGRREGREGGAATYVSPHIRLRDWDADTAFLVALRLDPPDASPSLDEIEAALRQPERPLFLGRKPALPSWPLVAGRQEARDIASALGMSLTLDSVRRWQARNATRGTIRTRDPARERAGSYRAEWPEHEGAGGRTVEIADERRWSAGVHGGLRRIVQGTLTATPAP